ncbi:MAG: hypothetical protein SFY69_08375 [Planctomycetota bacterium]|nr:hypothetical protein [Planctomycetota bacterium]
MIAPRATLIGVDLTGGVVRLAQGDVRGGRVRVRAWASGVRSPAREPGAIFTPEDASLVAGLVRRGGFSGDRVGVVLPQPLVLSASLELPPRSSGAPLDQIARLELARASRVDASGVHHVMWEVPPPPRAKDGLHAMCLGVVRDRVEPIIERLEDEGLECVAMESGGMAMARAADALALPGVLTCVLDVGWDGLTIVLVLDRAIVFERVVESTSWRQVCEDVGARGGLPPDLVRSLARTTDASADASPALPERVRGAMRGVQTDFGARAAPEVARSLAYAAHRYPGARPGRVLLCGEGWHASGLRERLAESLGLPVQELDPARLWEIDDAGPGRAPIDPAFAIALGVAVRDVPTRAGARRAA